MSQYSHPIVNNEYFGIKIPQPKGWKLAVSEDWTVWCSTSPEGGEFIFLAYSLDRELDTREVVEKVFRLVYGEAPVKIRRVSRREQVERFEVSVKRSDFLLWTYHFESKATISPTEYSPSLYNVYESNAIIAGTFEPYKDFFVPIEVSWKVVKGVGLLKDTVEREPKLLVELTYIALQSEKYPSLLGFDVPRRLIFNQGFSHSGYRWSIEIPITWDAIPGLDGVTIMANSKSRGGSVVSIYIEPVELENDLKSYVRKKYGKAVGELVLRDREGWMRLVYEHRGEKRVKRVMWFYFTRVDAYGRTRKFALEITMFYPLEVENILNPVLDSILSSWKVYEKWLYEKLGFEEKRFREALAEIRRSQELIDSALAAHRRASRIVTNELRKEIEHRRRMSDMARRTFGEIRKIREDTLMKQRRASEQYWKTMSSILGRTWTSKPRAKSYKSSLSGRTRGARRRPGVEKYDWAGMGVFYIDSDGVIRSRDYEDEVVAERMGSDGVLYDSEGKRVGYVEDGYVYDLNGNRVGVLDTSISDQWQLERYEQEIADKDQVFGYTVWGANYDREEEESESVYVSSYKRDEEGEEE